MVANAAAAVKGPREFFGPELRAAVAAEEKEDLNKASAKEANDAAAAVATVSAVGSDALDDLPNVILMGLLKLAGLKVGGSKEERSKPGMLKRLAAFLVERGVVVRRSKESATSQTEGEVAAHAEANAAAKAAMAKAKADLVASLNGRKLETLKVETEGRQLLRAAKYTCGVFTELNLSYNDTFCTKAEVLVRLARLLVSDP
jgi:hypothetical protein